MASIKDAFEDVFHDNNSFIKLVILAIPVYFCTSNYINGQNITEFWWVYLSTFLLLFGFVIKCTANVRNAENYILPKIDIINLLWAGIKGFVAIGPSIAINYFIANYLCDFTAKYITDTIAFNIFKYVIWSIFTAIILTCYLGYSKNFKIKEAYNLKTISNSSMDILIAVLFMIPQVLLAAALVLVPVCYLLWLFFGISHSISIFYYCIVFVFILAVTGHYLAQIDYENIKEEEL